MPKLAAQRPHTMTLPELQPATHHRVIPLQDIRPTGLPVPANALDGAALPTSTGLLTDRRGRVLRDLRISVTDRCNFRCSYCMPKEIFTNDYAYIPHAQLLSFEEVTRLARLFVAQGVEKIRLTGGEPLLRKGLESLIAQLSELRTPNGNPLDLTLTTNGALLARKAKALRAAGLQRITVSLDALDDAIFRTMNDVDFPVATVLEGIEAARAAGLAPIKINMVVKRGTNDHEIVRMARHFRHSGMVLRFIEFMDVGATNGWRMDDVVPSAEVLARLREVGELIALEPAVAGETAERWAWADGAGEIGLISSVTHAFCGSCNRARLSTEGQLYLCLFADKGYALRELLRGGTTDAQLARAIAAIWSGRDDHYSEIRAQLPPDHGAAVKRIEMSYIGG